MANVAAAIKQIRKDSKKRLQNQSVLSELKSLTKKLAEVAKEKPAEAGAFARTVVSKWDRAASSGVVPKGRANRNKARIAGLLSKLKTSS